LCSAPAFTATFLFVFRFFTAKALRFCFFVSDGRDTDFDDAVSGSFFRWSSTRLADGQIASGFSTCG
jgi:hypothetical protein